MKQATPRSDIQLLEEISKKLTELTAITGLSGRAKDEQISYLTKYDLTNSDIARLTGYPEGTVGRIRAEKSKQKKAKK